VAWRGDRASAEGAGDSEKLMDAALRREVLNIYAALMEEIKERVARIDWAIDKASDWPSPEAVHEFCYLQLRMICESIALACLLAQGHIGMMKKLKAEYSADRIIKHLETLHPHFFPRPVRTKEDGIEIVQNGSFITKKGLITLYARCGSVLHRGSIKTINPKHRQAKVNFSDLKGILKTLEELLSCHAMFLLDKKTMVVCYMRHPEANGGFRWYALESDNFGSLLASP
jgi:hypothetical protein